MKKLFFTLVFATSTAIIFAQTEGPLGGKYEEVSSTAMIEGQQLRYWLYRLPSSVDFDDFVAEFCEFMENRYVLPAGMRMGWPIYWDGIRDFNPNPNLASSVITMMSRLRRNVSVWIDQNNEVEEFIHQGERIRTSYPPANITINYYDEINNKYRTLYIPFYL